MQELDTLPSALDIAPLRPARPDSLVIANDTEVLCINRGPAVLEDMFDSVPFKIPPGYFTVQYAGAKHFKSRRIVPGTRNPELRTVDSFIGIIGLVRYEGDRIVVLKRVDPPEACQPFTPEQVAALALQLEGLDRAHMLLPITPPSAEIVNVNDVRVTMAGAGASIAPGGRRIIDAGAIDQIPAEEHEGIRAAHVAAAEAAAEPVEAEDVAPVRPKGRR